MTPLLVEIQHLLSSSKAKDIEGRLLSLHESRGLQRHAGCFKDDEVVFKVLEDLQDSISDYQVRP